MACHPRLSIELVKEERLRKDIRGHLLTIREAPHPVDCTTANIGVKELHLHKNLVFSNLTEAFSPLTFPLSDHFTCK